MFNSFKKPAATAIALSLGLALSACGGQPTNRSLDSIKQPVVERQNFTLDVRTGGAGLSVPEQQRLIEWFETLDVKYGDRVSTIRSPARLRKTQSRRLRGVMASWSKREHRLRLAMWSPAWPAWW
jgi:hypothetical protein